MCNRETSPTSSGELTATSGSRRTETFFSISSNAWMVAYENSDPSEFILVDDFDIFERRHCGLERRRELRICFESLQIAFVRFMDTYRKREAACDELSAVQQKVTESGFTRVMTVEEFEAASYYQQEKHKVFLAQLHQHSVCRLKLKLCTLELDCCYNELLVPLQQFERELKSAGKKLDCEIEMMAYHNSLCAANLAHKIFNLRQPAELRLGHIDDIKDVWYAVNDLETIRKNRK